jgi:hypothetical protein
MGTAAAELELAAAIHGNNGHGGVEGVRASGKRGMSGRRARASAREEARCRDVCPSGGGHGLMHGGHAHATRCPLRQFSEQMAGNRVTDVGANFGPLPG